jgi:hypothetical protein
MVLVELVVEAVVHLERMEQLALLLLNTELILKYGFLI